MSPLLSVVVQDNLRFLLITFVIALVASGMDVFCMLLLPAFLLVTLYSPQEVASFPRFGIANWALDFPVVLLLGLMVGIFLARSGVAIFAAYVLSRLGARIRRSVGQKIAHYYLNCPIEELSDRPLSEIMAVVNSHCDVFANQVVIPFLRAIVNSTIVVVIVVFIGYLEAAVLVAVLPVLLLLGGVFLLVVRAKTTSLFDSFLRTQREYQKQIAYAFRGPREVRLLQRQGVFLNRMRSILQQRALAASGLAALRAAPRALSEISAVILAIGYMYYKNHIDAPSAEIVAYMGIFAFAALRLISCFSNIIGSVALVRGGKRVVGILSRELGGSAQIDARATICENSQNMPDPEPFGELAISDLSFRYTGQDAFVLQHLDFELRRNESVGIMGKSGAGKSTFTDVLLGLLEPASGVVHVNGHRKTLSCPSWWGQVGFVPQAPFIADDTLANNIAFGCSPDEIDECRLQEVIQLACLESVVEQLPRGMYSNVGDLGGKLSGGQCQRIAIARALYFEREILIFDEATSSLDENTEAEIVDAIDSLRHDVTTVVIAHRKSTLRHCDRVLALEDGRLREISLKAV